MQTTDFVKPTVHPYGMLSGYTDASEKESFLVWMLIKCIEVGEFMAINTTHEHPDMVKLDLLEKVGEKEYKLTKKSIGLLYSHYGI